MDDPRPFDASKAVLSVVVATSNRGKLTELRALLADLPLELLPLVLTEMPKLGLMSAPVLPTAPPPPA